MVLRQSAKSFFILASLASFLYSALFHQRKYFPLSTTFFNRIRYNHRHSGISFSPVNFNSYTLLNRLKYRLSRLSQKIFISFEKPRFNLLIKIASQLMTTINCHYPFPREYLNRILTWRISIEYL